MARLIPSWSGRAWQLCPGTSDVDFLRNLNGVVNLDAKVANGALDLGVAQEELHGPQVASSSVNQRGFGPAERVRSELQRIETDAGNPLANKACVLSGGQAAVDTAPASEQELAGASASDPKMFVDGLPGLLGQFEPHRSSGLLLTNRSTIQRVAIGGHVVDADGHHVATAQLAVDGEIE
jgi:hypothetical protein